MNIKLEKGISENLPVVKEEIPGVGFGTEFKRRARPLMTGLSGASNLDTLISRQPPGGGSPESNTVRSSNVSPPPENAENLNRIIQMLNSPPYL